MEPGTVAPSRPARRPAGGSRADVSSSKTPLGLRPLVFLGCAVAALALAAPAAAHKGLFFTDRVRQLAVGDGTTSSAASGRLDPRHATAAITMRLRKGERLYVELLLPDRPTERRMPRSAWPTLRVSSPGGSTTVRPLRRPSSFFEPITRTRYLRLAVLDRLAPIGGAYRLDVHGRRGRFVIAPGFVERFGLADLLQAPEVIARVRAWYRAP